MSIEDMEGDDLEALTSTPQRDLLLWLQMIREARLLYGRGAAVELWRRSPLPVIADPRAIPDDVVGSFIEGRCVLKVDGRTESSTLYQAYLAWCVEGTTVPLTQAMFGRELGLRGLPAVKSGSGRMVRIGVALK